MSKIILLLFGVALVAVVQGAPGAKPCYGGGGSRYPQQPYPYTQYPQQPAPAPAPLGPPLTPQEQAWYDYFVAMEAQEAQSAPPPAAPAPAPAPAPAAK